MTKVDFTAFLIKIGFQSIVDCEQCLLYSRIHGKERKIFDARAAKPRVARAPESELLAASPLARSIRASSVLRSSNGFSSKRETARV